MTVLVRSMAIVVLLSAAAPALAQDMAPEGIGWGSMGAWGSSWHKVFVGRDGKVVISSYNGTPPPEPCKPPEPGKTAICPPPRKGIFIIRYTVGATGFDQIRAILAPLESKAAGPRGKTCGMSDAGSASVGWRIDGKSTGYALGSACKQSEIQWADAIADAAGRKLSELQSLATDRTETAE